MKLPEVLADTVLVALLFRLLPATPLILLSVPSITSRYAS